MFLTTKDTGSLTRGLDTARAHFISSRVLLVRVPKRGGGAAIRTDRNQPEATYNTRQFGGWIEVRAAAIRRDRN